MLILRLYNASVILKRFLYRVTICNYSISTHDYIFIDSVMEEKENGEKYLRI